MKQPAYTEQPWFLESVARQLAGLLPEESRSGGGAEPLLSKIPYNAAAALAYARAHCNRVNACGKMFPGDCSHFMSHCLAAGGITVKGSSPEVQCPAGLCIRAEELAAHLHNMSRTFSNVAELTFDDRTAFGDYGMFLNFLSPDHAFLLAAPVEPDGRSAKVFAHTNPHCGDTMFDPQLITARYYRISP